MRAMDLALKVVNEIGNGKFEIEEFMTYMPYEHIVGTILGEAEILRPTGVLDVEDNMIYENYIIEAESTDMLGGKTVCNYVVNYSDSHARFEGLELGNDKKRVYPLSSLKNTCDLKIVGNIYQNKDLLEANS